MKGPENRVNFLKHGGFKGANLEATQQDKPLGKTKVPAFKSANQRNSGSQDNYVNGGSEDKTVNVSGRSLIINGGSSCIQRFKGEKSHGGGDQDKLYCELVLEGILHFPGQR